MEEMIKELKSRAVGRIQEWEAAKNPQHATSIFVCNRRIQKLDEALALIAQIESIDEYTK